MKTYGLIGVSLEHSFSQLYFTTKFKQEGKNDCEYLNFQLPHLDQFENLIRTTTTLHGLNVTLPYKIAIKEKLNCLSPQAQDIGAVNVIEFLNNGELKGHNTDCIGFENTFIPLLQTLINAQSPRNYPNSYSSHKALILGKGGAALAVEYILKKYQISYTYVSRQPQKNDFSYSELTQEILQECSIIINTSPLGMSSQPHTFPNIPYQFIGSQHLCYDLVYLPPELGLTTFLKKCQAQGATVKDGFEMLWIQAEFSWKIWTASEESLYL